MVENYTALPVHQMNGGTVTEGAMARTLRSTQKNRQKALLSTAKTRKIPLCKFDIEYTATGT